jgi:hypothetical protein
LVGTSHTHHNTGLQSMINNNDNISSSNYEYNAGLIWDYNSVCPFLSSSGIFNATFEHAYP